MRNNKSSPLVSIIVPTLNSAKYLHKTLTSLVEQTYKNKEIIVVDNYSTDNTVAVARRFGVKVYLHGTERASQIDFGIQHANGKYIFETGSDMVSDGEYVREAVEKCENENYDAIYSSVVSAEGKNFWHKVKAFERLMYIGSNQIEAAHFFKKEAYLMIGGIDPNLISVEEDIQHRLDKFGYKTGRIKSREVHLHEVTNLKEVFDKSFYYGMYLSNYLKKYPTKGTLHLFPIRICFILNFWRFLVHPLLGTGLIILKFVQYTGGILGILNSKSKRLLHRRVYGKSSAN